MFGFGKGKKKRDGSDIKNLNDIKLLIEHLGEYRAGEVIRESARGGNLICQIFMSQTGIYLKQSRSVSSIEQDTEVFTTMAAENGHAQSQFNLAQIFINKLDSRAEFIDEEQFNHIIISKFWHRKAAEQGYRPSIEALKDLESFPDTWAEMVDGAE